MRDTAAWVESLVRSDPDADEDLLVYLSLTSKLTNPVIASILSKRGATAAVSKMSTLREMWEQQQREHLRVETLAETLIIQLETRFGGLNDEQRHRVQQADEEELKKFLKRFAKADSLVCRLRR